MYIKNYDSNLDVIEIICNCNAEIKKDISEKKEMKYLEELGEYENFYIKCEQCKSTHFLNMNIPESDYEEVELEETTMPYFDVNNRKMVRDLMWKKRSDLKGKDRALYNQEKKAILDEWKAKKGNNGL